MIVRVVLVKLPKNMRDFFALFLLAQVSGIDIPLETQVALNLGALEEQIYAPSNAHLSSLSLQLVTLGENVTTYRNEALQLIVLHTEYILAKVQTVAEGLDDDLNAACSEHIEENFKQLHLDLEEELTDAIFGGLKSGHKVLADVRAVCLEAQNRTTEIHLAAESCLSLLNEDECLEVYLAEIVRYQTLLPAILEIAMNENQLIAVEAKVISDVEKIVYKGMEVMFAVLNDFMVCVLQGEKLA